MRNSLIAAWMVDASTLTKVPPFTDGTEGKVSGDMDSGALLTAGNDLEPSSDSVTAVPTAADSSPVVFVATATGTERLSGNAARKGLIFANSVTDIMYVLFASSGTPSVTNFHLIVPVSSSVILDGLAVPKEAVRIAHGGTAGDGSVTELA